MSDAGEIRETATTVAPSPLYKVAVASYISLMALLAAWVLVLDPPPPAVRILLLVIFLLPLMLGLPGLLARRRYTMQWTGMLSLAYFVHGLIAATGLGLGRWLGSIEVLLALTYFGCSLLVLRYGKRAHQAAKAARETSESSADTPADN